MERNNLKLPVAYKRFLALLNPYISLLIWWWWDHSTAPSVQSLRGSRFIRVLIQFLPSHSIGVHILSRCVKSVCVFYQLLLIKTQPGRLRGIRIWCFGHKRGVLHHLFLVRLRKIPWKSFSFIFCCIFIRNLIDRICRHPLELNNFETSSFWRALVSENIFHSGVKPLSICGQIVRRSHCHSWLLVNHDPVRALVGWAMLCITVYV